MREQILFNAIHAFIDQRKETKTVYLLEYPIYDSGFYRAD